MYSQNQFNVLIIGGGVSGLAAAKYLADNGISHCVLEGSGRLGGRMFSVPFAGVQVDIGITTIDGGLGNPFYDLAVREGLKLHKMSDDSDKDVVLFHCGALASQSPSEEVLAESDYWVEEFLGYVGKEAENAWTDQKMGTFLKKFEEKKQFTTLQKAYFEYAMFTEFESEYGASIDDMSMWNLGDPSEWNSDQYIIEQGFGALVPAMARGVNYLLNKDVYQIDHSSEGVQVKTKDGDVFSAYKVILAVPMGVLKQNLIQITPKLPSKKKEAIQMFETTADITIYLEFPDLFWDPKCSWIGCISDDREDSLIFVNLVEVFNKPVLMVEMHPKKAERVMEWTDTQIVTMLTNALRLRYPSCPDPTTYMIPKLATDPFFYGSGTYITKAETTSHPAYQFSEAVDGRLFFSGDAAAEANNCSPLASYNSGLDAAKKIAQSLH
mmetsp:Transcript_33033/g.37501  ORF Transcript_33033/g.37501 Transcript_33033/m.37501 type:complete len:438 (-) Transcript_33033:413-1726(-)|eukprot:CAMPEP_0114994508 /NCGR_PEP_ID=MMETSP0216-20121206/13178_1 /TAXON_ID=223996 /ORGANISM="Protocruzia adherens, Strain Boccale" /LENGTH=437 /DNA_ID=CAMNT_0002358377 /DNA_START=135 /DNA_END=1448 /DNA_ORIENTATION=-